MYFNHTFLCGHPGVATRFTRFTCYIPSFFPIFAQVCWRPGASRLRWPPRRWWPSNLAAPRMQIRRSMTSWRRGGCLEVMRGWVMGKVTKMGMWIWPTWGKSGDTLPLIFYNISIKKTTLSTPLLGRCWHHSRKMLAVFFCWMTCFDHCCLEWQRNVRHWGNQLDL